MTRTNKNGLMAIAVAFALTAIIVFSNNYREAAASTGNPESKTTAKVEEAENADKKLK